MHLLFKSIATLLLVVTCFTGTAFSSERFEIHHSEATSRDYFYFHIPSANETLSLEGFVGGEHINHYRILAFSQQRFTVSVTSLSGEAYFSIDSEAIEVTHNGSAYDIQVNTDGIWIDVAISASTFTSEYVLDVKRVF
jgi:hypothetical protein